MTDLEHELAAAVREHDRQATMPGWNYDERAVRAAYARVEAARLALHPLVLSGAVDEVEFFGGNQ